MAVGRAERREQRTSRFEEVFGERAETALDLFEILELAWHDCYGEVSPPSTIEDHILVVSEGTMGGLIGACRLALQDWRDLSLRASDLDGL